MDTSKDIRNKLQEILDYETGWASVDYYAPDNVYKEKGVDSILQVFKEYIEEKYSSTISNNITGYKKDLLEGLEKEGYE